MTAQVSDYCKCEDVIYSIVATTDWFAFNPSIFGLAPDNRRVTSVAKGYWTGYAIIGDKLYIDQLNIRIANDNYPEINGVKAKNSGVKIYEAPDGQTFTHRRNLGFWIYDGLNYSFPFTGKFLMGTDRMKEAKYSNMGGIDRYWKYRNLLSLEFKDGNLVEIFDVSSIGKQIWRFIEDNRNDKIGFDIFQEYDLEKQAEVRIENNAWWIKKTLN